MQTGYRFRCYPTREQASILLHWVGCQRWVYNAKVQEDRYFRAYQKRFVALAGVRPPIDQKYSQFIGDDTAWLRNVPSQVLRNGVVRWRKAYARFFKRLGGRPKIKKRAGRQSVWLTDELFTIEQRDGGCALVVGTRKFPVGAIPFTAHRPFPALPATVSLSVEGDHWFVGFSLEDDVPEPTRDEIGEHLERFPEAELREFTLGLDRNTLAGRQVAASNGEGFCYSAIQQRRMAKKAKAAQRYQKRMSRETRGSCAWRKNRRKLGNAKRYIANTRRDFAHQTSRALVDDPAYRIYGFENLQIQNMVRRPKAKRDEHGRWQKNGAAAKAGLNAAILNAGWGQLYTFTTYKAQRAGKLTVQVPAPGSSQECSVCGHTHPDNRPSQAAFVCQACGHAENADANAAAVIRGRAVAVVRQGRWRNKPVQRTMRLRQKTQVGPERSEPAPQTAPTSAETAVSRGRGQSPAAHGSMKPETPATASA